MSESDSVLMERTQCPKCAEQGNDTSCDNLAVYSDGHSYCYACKYYQKGENSAVNYQPAPKEFTPIKGVFEPIPSRNITEDTCRQFNYQLFNHNDKKYHVASYYKKNELVAQHFRSPEKKFWWKGETVGTELFGQHRFEKGGKRLVITEGELDAMSVYQANGGWPVVSIPSGTTSAEASIKQNLEFISSYDEVIIMFDMDEAGQEAARKVAAILPVGKTKIAQLPRKDANDCLMNGDERAIKTAIFQAHLYSPDEIVHVSQVSSKDPLEGKEIFSFPWDELDQKLIGQRSGEITLWVSGPGSGKSTIIRELAYNHLQQGQSVGMMMFEESEEETLDDLISLMINAPVRVIRATKMLNEKREKEGKPPVWVNGSFTEEEYNEARDWLTSKPLYFYNHEGNNAYKSAIARMEYLAVSLGVDVIILDHITALTAGMMESNDDGERVLIDRVMKDLRSLVSRTGVRIDVISQLKKGSKSYDDGDPISSEDVRGSASLNSVPNTVIAMERNKQHPDVFVSNCTALRVLKNRLVGHLGVMGALHYNSTTGRMEEVTWHVAEEDDRWGNKVYRTMFNRKT